MACFCIEKEKHFNIAGKKTLASLIDKEYADECSGVRCIRGKCVSMNQVCNGVRDCEDGKDEAEEACERKHTICDKDPYHRGCGK